MGPQYVGLFRVLARLFMVAYRLDLPKELRQIHSPFHVSQLLKCVANNSTVVPLDDIQVDDNLDYVEWLMAILDRKMKALLNKVISFVKV